MGRQHEARVQAQAARQRGDEAVRVFAGVAVGVALVGEQAGVVPAGLAVGAPANLQRPARQLFARVPLALAEMQEAALAVLGQQPVHQFGGKAALGGAQGVGVPLGRLAVVHGHEGGLAAHGQAHVLGFELVVDAVAQGHDGLPLGVGVGHGDARAFVDARDLHVVRELHLAFVHAPTDRGCRRRFGRAGHGDMTFTGHQARGRVQADPARAGQVDLAPGVQVGEVDLGARGAVERPHVGLELDQVPRHEARRQPQVAQQLHQQPAGVAA